MRLKALRVQNYCSIVDSEEIRIEPFQALVGENNTGKSNLLRSIQVFLTSGKGGVTESHFFDGSKPIVITATFAELTEKERKRLRKYLLGDKLILEKHVRPGDEEESKTGTEYHGYEGKPKDWWLSTEGVVEHEGTTRPKWDKIAEECGIIDYVRDKTTGKVNKESYQRGLEQYLAQNPDIEFEEPRLGETQALGRQPTLLKYLPTFRLLPAITDYSDEVDKRSSQTTFRLLMGDLANRIIQHDPRYKEVKGNLEGLTFLLNAPTEKEERKKGQERLEVLGKIEGKLKEIFAQLVPTVQRVLLKVVVDEIQDIFSRGVEIEIDDGKLTGVLMKGHGLQRCVVFGLIRALVLNQRGELIDTRGVGGEEYEKDERTIILGIEEPELYIHPQMQRLVHGVLKSFSTSDQVMYSTHSPAFVDVGTYESIAVVRKDTVAKGTKITQCDAGILDAPDERKTFQFITSFGLEQNSMFFARKVVLVEGANDRVALLAAGRALKLFEEFPEEINCSVITASKGDLPKFLKLFNVFAIPYALLHELDGKPADSKQNKEILELVGKDRTVMKWPERLEAVVGRTKHFDDQYDAVRFFGNPDNIGEKLKTAAKALFS